MTDKEKIYELDLSKYEFEENYEEILRIVSLNLGWIANITAVFNSNKEKEKSIEELERIL